MFFKLVFACYMLMNIDASIESDFIIDYYDYKGVSNIVGFTCNIVTGNY